ncbi:acyl-CoA carboxylase subunit epsilon [Microbacterium deminutum]|uniref:Acyl-CoA carboxylase subunit epsilon n=1 Tax=Microbacterium deminutum TaxID=344164 RepID=A0ABP5BJ43_9MICO
MSDPGPEEDLRIDVRRGLPTDEELAALIAVVSESYARESAAALAEEKPERNAWMLSQRSLRDPVRRELGWGRFGG